MKNQTEEIIWQMAGQKERLIEEGISHIVGHRNWTIKDITGRCKIHVLPDNTEVFMFDGKELLHFQPIKTVIDSGVGCCLKVTQEYRKLY